MVDQDSKCIRVSYDELADVLYISLGPKVRARSTEDAHGIVWRVAEDGLKVGATVQHFRTWTDRQSALINRLSQSLMIERGPVLKALAEFSA